MTTGRINQVAEEGTTRGARRPRSLRCWRARRHHRRWLSVHARRNTTRLCQLRGSIARPALDEGSPLTSTVALPLLAAPHADGAWESTEAGSRPKPDRSEANDDFVGVAGTPTAERTANNWRTPSKHRSITPGARTKHQQPALSADQPTGAFRLTRSTEQLLHASPPRLMHSLAGPGALFGCLTITQMATTNAIVCYHELELGER